jgi:hypothetical protein
MTKANDFHQPTVAEIEAVRQRVQAAITAATAATTEARRLWTGVIFDPDPFQKATWSAINHLLFHESNNLYEAHSQLLIAVEHARRKEPTP